MNNVNELIDRYIAMWHEQDPARRRRTITKLWAEDGVDLLRTLEARGYDAIEARVTAAHEKWVRDGGFVFRSLNCTASHHNAVKFNWEMVPKNGGEAAATGFDFFILNDDGRIRILYQFGTPSPSNELDQFASRYVAVWNEPDPQRRRSGIAALWNEDGELIDRDAECRGYDEIAEAIDRFYDQFAKGFSLKPGHDVDGHHNVARTNWEMVPKSGGEVPAVGLDFFILDDEGRIRCDYQFHRLSEETRWY